MLIGGKGGAYKKACTPSYNAVIFYKFVFLTLTVIDRGPTIGTNHISVPEIILSIVCGWRGRDSIEYGRQVAEYCYGSTSQNTFLCLCPHVLSKIVEP